VDEGWAGSEGAVARRRQEEGEPRKAVLATGAGENEARRGGEWQRRRHAW
jgi:hypothetical protein